ncbi:thiolase domain-containing protein [Aminipila butyrica]|uniref:Thiolase domain-containing protein n=1 Tax=Aminipila butyrica TaxID=433296 RepID=A0A858BY60_9FIRM|nr:thiolase domain-containing protein [Aminipila butyrica]QIB70382.1 thiolase domain-containing protein [Aminipila butyrica]
MRSVSIIGIGETKMGNFPNRTLREMISEAGNTAIKDAGVEKKEIQAIFFGNFVGQQLTGQGHMGALVSETLGLGHIPAIRMEGACASGGLAFRSALIAVASGMYDTVLVGGAEKMTHQATPQVTESIASAMDYNLEAMQGYTFPANFAMIANRYFYEHRNVKKEMAMCAVNAHHNATLNPDAQMPKELDLNKVLAADTIASPLSLFDCSLITDGAAFLVLTTTERAKQISQNRVVEVIGSGHAGDTLTLFSKKTMTSFAAAKEAAKQAYTQANLKPADIDFAEVHDCFTITQIINIEDLGFAEPGHGGDLVAEGGISIEGSKPINVSGGLKAKGHPIGATGISQIFEVVTQLRGDAGKRQLKKNDIGLTHNLGGTAATAIINIFKGL